MKTFVSALALLAFLAANTLPSVVYAQPAAGGTTPAPAPESAAPAPAATTPAAKHPTHKTTKHSAKKRTKAKPVKSSSNKNSAKRPTQSLLVPSRIDG